MILRSRLIFSVVPRRESGVIVGGVTPAGDVPAPVGPLTGAAAAAGWAACSAWRAASRTSCLRIRPPTPEPVTVDRSTSCWAASLRTSGVTYPAPSPEPPEEGAADHAEGAGPRS